MQEIICVLDKSGSMQTVADDAVHGFNRFLKDQQDIGSANLTLIWFDHFPVAEYSGPLSKAKPIQAWPNGGSTALLDAIGFAFKETRYRFEKPEKVILAILTDGHENASQNYTTEAVAGLIKEHQDKYNWEVIYLAADQDAWAVAQHLNIRRENAIDYASTNTIGGMSVYSATVSRARK